jgi:hypothetical protein
MSVVSVCNYLLVPEDSDSRCYVKAITEANFLGCVKNTESWHSVGFPNLKWASLYEFVTTFSPVDGKRQILPGSQVAVDFQSLNDFVIDHEHDNGFTVSTIHMPAGRSEFVTIGADGTATVTTKGIVGKTKIYSGSPQNTNADFTFNEDQFTAVLPDGKTVSMLNQIKWEALCVVKKPTVTEEIVVAQTSTSEFANQNCPNSNLPTIEDGVGGIN